MLGGGQLGRMFALEARRLGYRVHVFEPKADSPAGQVADREVNAEWSDLGALRKFAAGVDVVTYEFENIPGDAVAAVSEGCEVLPGAGVLHVCQNREREKSFLRENGFPCAPFWAVGSAVELAVAMGELGEKGGVLKTAESGYDGKGQVRVASRKVGRSDGRSGASRDQLDADADGIWRELGAERAVLEGWVEFEKEFSVICARGRDGEVSVYPVAENVHRDHILERSIVPARIPAAAAAEGMRIAAAVAERLDVVGVIAVECFLLRDGSVLVNEMAPRPHNSGHFSFDACVTSQFEQQLRAVCGLPLGSVDLLRPVVMVNLLGDRWADGEPDWAEFLRDPNLKLHLYGKDAPRAGRKMGHVCVLGRPGGPAPTEWNLKGDASNE
jgi:5-(carboxyamino)imidazole ribonucleotide synthase